MRGTRVSPTRCSTAAVHVPAKPTRTDVCRLADKIDRLRIDRSPEYGSGGCEYVTRGDGVKMLATPDLDLVYSEDTTLANSVSQLKLADEAVRSSYIY